MSRQVKSIIYYDGQICNVEFGVEESLGIVSGKNYKVAMQISCIVDPYKYELFDVISETHLETVISSHISSKNDVIELYVKFINVDESSPSSTTIATNTGTEAEAESPTTGLCCGFSGILQSGYYNIFETSMGRHSSISDISLKFRGQYQSGIRITQM
ncbi:hypothetical protein J1N35_010250 [Gossypium stocksii]|uniref:Uncharacterized protein n=1 Tax=Gossypium stocksii TaxID=47602 RepID=A0A9D4AAC7_9ROSI|nr:hypothetical protein J1N35_010250 [Gossypium stocksii]